MNGIDFENGKVTIDTDGNFHTTGTVTAKKYTVDTSDPLSASVGEATIPAGKTEIEINTSAVTNKSQIFTSPDEALDFSIGVIKKNPGKSFTAKIIKSLPDPIKFSWWIVN